jgi:hypothetical protein
MAQSPHLNPPLMLSGSRPSQAVFVSESWVADDDLEQALGCNGFLALYKAAMTEPKTRCRTLSVDLVIGSQLVWVDVSAGGVNILGSICIPPTDFRHDVISTAVYHVGPCRCLSMSRSFTRWPPHVSSKRRAPLTMLLIAGMRTRTCR